MSCKEEYDAAAKDIFEINEELLNRECALGKTSEGADVIDVCDLVVVVEKNKTYVDK